MYHISANLAFGRREKKYLGVQKAPGGQEAYTTLKLSSHWDCQPKFVKPRAQFIKNMLPERSRSYSDQIFNT